MAEKALGGVKVLEWCNLVAGPYCAKLLADLGAEVIKIEEPGVGDESRRRGPFLNDIPHPERSGLFLYLNTNKLGITLNLNDPRGRRIFTELVKQADILVEDKPVGERKRLGVDYQSLHEFNPRLIMTSIIPFGQTGPYSNYKAYPLNVFHGSGEGYITPGGTEYFNRPPIKVANYVGEYDAGLQAGVATLAALFWRGVSGSGQHIDVSKQEAVMSLQRLDMPRYANEGLLVNRPVVGYLFGGILPCKDGYTVVITWLPHEWDRLMELMGNPSWSKDERYKDLESRRQHHEEVNAFLMEWTSNYTKQELYHMGQAKGVAFGMVMTTEDLANSEQVRAREFFVEVEHAEVGKIKYPSTGYKFSRTPWELSRPAPLQGQHNEEIYCQRLNYSKEDLIRLRESGVI